MFSELRERLFNLVLIVLTLAAASCSSQDATTGVCGGDESITDDLRYIKSKATVSLGDGKSGHFDIYVQRLEKTGAYTWTQTPVSTFDDGKTPCEALQGITTMWKSFYEDMAGAGINSEVIDHYISSISAYYGDPARSSAGVYAETYLGACGYSGAPGTIRCGLGSDDGFKRYYLAHENTHGFQWDWSNGDTEGILLYRLFAAYANALYQQSITDANQLVDTGGAWSLDLMDYALQNEAEWLADIFRDYLYPGTGHWSYIKANQPALASFFDCVWKSGKSFTECQNDTAAPAVSFANSVPIVNIPSVSGFNATESEAIWNVCFNSTDKSNHTTVFDQLIDSLTPTQYGSSADKFHLGYGDCDHNGVIDWICSYQGAAPDGGNYLWNSNNQNGTYTFIASGDSGNGYAEYKQDPYLTLPSINGSLAQPMYREWQGTYGSCNGARYFNQVPERFPVFASQANNLPAEFDGKTTW